MADPLADRPARLAIVGASCRGAAQSALRAGFEVVTADLFADMDLRRIAQAHRVNDYPSGFEEWLARSPADAWMYTGALENYPDLVDRMARVKPLWGVHGEALRAVRHYTHLRRRLAQAGLHTPETRASADGLPQNGQWLCKTHRGSSGSGVWALDSPAALRRAQQERAEFQRSLASEGGWPGAVVYVLSGEGSRTLGVTRQLVGESISGAAPFQYAGSIHPARPISAPVIDELERMRSLLAVDFGLRGLVGVDLWIDQRHAWVLEVNPRYTASVEVLEQATGARAVSLHADAWDAALRDIDCSPSQSAAAAVGKLIYFAERGVLVTNEFSTWALSLAHDGPWSGIADVPAAGQVIPRGRPVLTVRASGEEATVEALFAERVAELRRRLYAGA